MITCEDFNQKKTTKKGGRRKTVSKRRAYIDTPSDLKRKKLNALRMLSDSIYNAKTMDSKIVLTRSAVMGTLSRIKKEVEKI